LFFLKQSSFLEQLVKIMAKFRTVVYFTKFFEQHLCQLPLAKKITNPSCKHIKAASNTFVQKNCL
jgi:hypothetical protein